MPKPRKTLVVDLTTQDIKDKLGELIALGGHKNPSEYIRQTIINQHRQARYHGKIR